MGRGVDGAAEGAIIGVDAPEAVAEAAAGMECSPAAAALTGLRAAGGAAGVAAGPTRFLVLIS